MAVNDLITFRKGTASAWTSANPVLASGEPGYDLTNSILKIGDGVSNWVALSGIGSTSVGGSSSSSVGVRGIISTTGILTSFAVSGGYSAGYLDLFQNGVKLLSGSDFAATDGTLVTLSNSVPSGTVLEYISLGTSVSSSNYTKLDSISSSFNGSSTSFGLAVSGTAYYPVSANTLGIYVGGVAQEPISSYSVSGSNIVFTEAPASGLTFWGVGYGTTAVATLNGIVPGSVSAPAVSSYNDLSTGFYSPSSGSLAIASSGYDRFKIDNSGNALFGGQNVDTLRYVDIGNINNSSNAGSILRLVTTNVSGTGNISADLVKYKNGQFSLHNNETNSAAFTSFNVGSSERLRITSSGNVGIGTTVPTSKLHVIGDITANSGNFTNNLQVNNVDVSVSGHSHTVSDIINFNSSVSGLLPITNIIAGSGINVAISGTTAIITGDDIRWNFLLPSAPTGLSATAGNTQATLSWTAPAIAVPLITDYSVQFSADGGTTWTTATDTVSAATTATITGLTNGVSYIFRVAGVNGIGTGEYSTASSPVIPTVFVSIQHLIIGGGGAGGGNAGGGGGAGQLLSGSNVSLIAGITYDITIGSGGIGGVANGSNGGESSLVGGNFSLIALGGGGGGGANTNIAANRSGASVSGGSGGGGGGTGVDNAGMASGGSGTYSGGNSGSSPASCLRTGGGGGGSSSAGANAVDRDAGAGGNGTSISITGSAVVYAGGGGGGAVVGSLFNCPEHTVGQGGTGGGGIGGASSNGAAGASNSGSGGGGGSFSNNNDYSGGAGGTGVIIIRSAAVAAATTGSPTITTVGGDTVYTFTQSGSITF
jgi:hypothetical protein